MIGGGDGALEDVERLFRCSKITVQHAVRILLSIHIDLSFRDNFNCHVKISTKYIPIRPIMPNRLCVSCIPIPLFYLRRSR